MGYEILFRLGLTCTTLNLHYSAVNPIHNPPQFLSGAGLPSVVALWSTPQPPEITPRFI